MKYSSDKFEIEAQQFIDGAIDMLEFCSEEEIINTFWVDALPSLPKGEYKRDVMLKLLHDYKVKMEAGELRGPLITFYKEEVKYMRSMEASDKIRFLYLVLTTLYKEKPHPSGFSRFDDHFALKKASKLGSFGPFCPLDLKNLIFTGFEMRVIGSKQPILCFKLPHAKFEGEIAFQCYEDELLDKFKEYIQ